VRITYRRAEVYPTCHGAYFTDEGCWMCQSSVPPKRRNPSWDFWANMAIMVALFGFAALGWMLASAIVRALRP
jgi:hypothetical protein